VTEYLTTDDVVDLYDYAMHASNDLGGGLRDRPKLEAAVMRPQYHAFYQDADLFEQAAVLACGISQSRAFVDGNKRIAQTSAAFFLAINGFGVTDPLEMARLVLSAAQPGTAQDQAERALAEWLRAHVRPLSQSEESGSSPPHGSRVRSPPGS
jgi:death-on-curing family protein